MSSVLVIGTYRQTLTVIRSLARAGQNVVLGVHGDAASCDHSKYVSEIWEYPDPDLEPNDFFESLWRLLADREDILTIIPVGERDIRLFASRYDEVSSRARLLMCEPGLVATCLDKPTLSAIVDRLEIPQSPIATVCDVGSLVSAADMTGYPCVVKLTDSEFLLHGEKARIYENAADLRRDFTTWPIPGKPVIVQSYISGNRLNLYFFARHGRITELGQVLALRTDRVNGTGLAVSGMTVPPDDILVRHCQTIVRDLNYTGVGCMQFLVDKAKGITSFLELNPRLGAGCVLPYLAGLDLPRLMLEFALGDESVPCELAHPIYPCRVGVRYSWTTGDLRGLKRALGRHEIGLGRGLLWLFAIVRNLLTTPNHVSWDWRDPMPTLALIRKSFASTIGIQRSQKSD